MSKISIYDFMNGSIRRSKWTISFILAILLTLVIGTFIAKETVENERRTLAAISPHLSYLLSIGDRTEIFRILATAAAKGNELSIIQNNIIYANPHHPELTDTKHRHTPRVSILGITVTKDSFIITSPLLDNNSFLSLEVPVTKIIPRMLVIMIAAFILTFSVLQFQTHIFKRQTERVLVSLKILERQIQKFGDTEELREEIDFRELEDIRLELSRTKSNLSETRGLLASQRAKEINAEVYKRLIHDLQNPISAMNTMITLISESDTPDDIKHEALDTLPKLTQEILSQIIATKKNFEYDASQFVNTDLRLCINESLIQIKLSHPEKFKKISFIDPSHSILIPCDPPSLKRAIINVIENGLDFSREKLEIRLSESKDGASIFIADDGPGLQKEKLEEIIRGLSKSGKGDRPALGLSSVSHILRKHNGRLSCQGSHLGGAEFELSLGII